MAKNIPEDVIEEIRINNDIIEVISEYVRLEQKGKLYFGLCPFHREKTPSFSVTPSMQIFKCFGCGKGGNVFNFISNVENLDYIEAVRFLADRVKIQLPEGESEDDKEKARLRFDILKINKEAALFYYNSLNSENGKRAMRYLLDRGMNEKTIRHFGLGYSHQEWDILYKYLLSKGYDLKLIAKSGLILPNKINGYYDRFRDRIIFPIFDIRSNVIGFGGRVMDSSMPKYMNSPESVVYNKGRNLFALNFAKKSGQRRVVIVEGYMDVISLHQGGIINSVASLGTALTENQGRLLKKYFDDIIICYDADSAGQAATMRGLDLLNDLGCNVRVLTVPDGKDPDDFIRKNGSEAFTRIMDHAQSLVEYKVRLLQSEMDTTTIEGKVAFVGKIADLLAKVGNKVEMEMYIRKLSDEYKVSQEAIYSEILKRAKRSMSYRAIVPDTSEKLVKTRNTIAGTQENQLIKYEQMLISLLCMDNNIYKHIKDVIEEPGFFTLESDSLAKAVMKKIEDGHGIVVADLFNLIEGDKAEGFSEIVQKECNFEDNRKAVLDIIKRMEIIRLDKRQQEILKLLGDKNSLAERDVDKLTRELNSLILKRKNSMN